MADVNGRLEPDYAKMERDWRDSMRKVLTEAQCGKLAWAMWNYHLDKEEPKLPKPAMLMFESYRSRLDYRREKSIEQLAHNQTGKGPLISRDSGETCEGSDRVLKETCEGSDRNQNSSEKVLFKNLEEEKPSSGDYGAIQRAVTARLPDGGCEHIERVIDTSTLSSRARAGAGAGFEEGERTCAPTLDEVRAYCEQCGLIVSPERFFGYYNAKGWRDKSGKPIRDWRSKLRAWNEREGHYPEKAQAADAGNGVNGRKSLKIGRITNAGKNEGEWYVHLPAEYAGPIPGSRGMSRDEAEHLATELYPDLRACV